MDELCDGGFCVIDSFLPPETHAQLYATEFAAWQRGAFKAGRIGTGDSRHAGVVRTDGVRWFDPKAIDAEHASFFARMGQLRETIRGGARLPLTHDEFHATVYEPGAFYRRHVDVFHNDKSGRLVSCVYYLNPEWSATDGGALRLYTSAKSFVDIYPEPNRLVLFQSERVPHEVLAPSKHRFAITGWMRR